MKYFYFFLILLVDFHSALAQVTTSFEIHSQQWSPSHPVRTWIENLTHQGNPPLYEGKSLESGIRPSTNQNPGIKDSLPTFTITKKNIPTEQLPVQEWLKTAHSEGAVDLVLRLTTLSPAGSSDRSEVLNKTAFLIKNKPSTLKLSYLNLDFSNESQILDNKPYGLIKVLSAPSIKDPLLINTCEHIGKALNTLQILKKEKTVFTTKWVFECDFKLRVISPGAPSKQIQPNELKIARLNLPLFDRDNFRFDVIGTLLDTQSVTALSKLRKKETETE